MSFVYYAALQQYPFPSILSQTIRLSLVEIGAGWAPDPENTGMMDAIPASQILGTSAPVSGKSFSGGIFKCSPVSFPNPVPSGRQVDGLLLWYDSGSPSTSRPLVWLDQFSGLPFIGNGIQHLTVEWAPGGVFAFGRS